MAKGADPAWMTYCGRDESAVETPRTVVIGQLEWTTYNLNVDTFRNGDPIPHAETAKEWIDACQAGRPAWCHYDNDPANAEAYGKLYTRHAVEDERGLAPDGWRIPEYDDWHALAVALGDDAGKQLKSVAGWIEDGGSNGSGFNALPAGSRYGNGGYHGLGEYAIFAVRNDGRFYITGIGALVGGFPRRLGGRWGYTHGNDGLAVRLVRKAPYDGYRVTPSGVPNPGILFIDRESTGRSGHMGNTLVECRNGDILAFYTNTSGIMHSGHLLDGWTEYRRSRDGGKTWSEPHAFEYSKQAWERNRTTATRDNARSRIVTAAVTAPNGTILAFTSWSGEPVVYHLSYDHGQTWSEPPRRLDANGSSSFNYNAVFVHDGTIYALFMEKTVNSGAGSLVLYVSADNGETFDRRSDNLFPGKSYQWYQTGRMLDDGRMVVYVYNQDTAQSPDEYLYYVISDDKGHTWSEPRVMHLAKRIRNPQMSDTIGGFYFMHGRSGSAGDDPGNLVLYKSADGIHWDDGLFLNKREGVLAATDGTAAYYSANTVVGAYDATRPKKLLIQASVCYSGMRVNTRHWWIEEIAPRQ